MKSSSNSISVGNSSVLGMLILLLILLISFFYITSDFRYFGLSEDILGRFWSIKWWLVGHLSGGVIALLIGPFQFWSNFRNKFIKVHRTLGKIYLIAIGIGAICSTILAWTSALAIHWTWAFSLQILAVVWISTSLMAYRTIRQRKIQQHKEWMIRSYIVTFGFIAFRFFNDTSALLELGNFVERAPTIVWMVWAIPLFFIEIIFQWNKK